MSRIRELLGEPAGYFHRCGGEWMACSKEDFDGRHDFHESWEWTQIHTLDQIESALQRLAAESGDTSSWWSALMCAAADLEQASNSITVDADAKCSALGAAAHWRKRATELAAEDSAKAAPVDDEAMRKGFRDCDGDGLMHGKTSWQIWRDACNWMARRAESLKQPADKPATEQAGGVPEGWKLVPVDPTDEMIYMMYRAFNNIDEKRDSYTRMLAAAPRSGDA